MLSGKHLKGVLLRKMLHPVDQWSIIRRECAPFWGLLPLDGCFAQRPLSLMWGQSLILLKIDPLVVISLKLQPVAGFLSFTDCAVGKQVIIINKNIQNVCLHFIFKPSIAWTTSTLRRALFSWGQRTISHGAKNVCWPADFTQNMYLILVDGFPKPTLSKLAKIPFYKINVLCSNVG